MPFIDRTDAGKQLAKALAGYKNRKPVILALPRGGVPVAAEIATALNAPLDLMLIRKIGVPWQPELAMGAVADGKTPIVIRNEQVIQYAGVEQADFDLVCARELVEIERRKQVYLGNRKSVDLVDRVVILVDDGIATGASVRAALGAIRNRQAKAIVLAVPVGPVDTLRMIRQEVDEVVCLEEYEEFGAIGLYYRHFAQLKDQEVIDILARFPSRAAT